MLSRADVPLPFECRVINHRCVEGNTVHTAAEEFVDDPGDIRATECGHAACQQDQPLCGVRRRD